MKAEMYSSTEEVCWRCERAAVKSEFVPDPKCSSMAVINPSQVMIGWRISNASSTQMRRDQSEKLWWPLSHELEYGGDGCGVPPWLASQPRLPH